VSIKQILCNLFLHRLLKNYVRNAEVMQDLKYWYKQAGDIN
jgi:hypothetical protein